MATLAWASDMNFTFAEHLHLDVLRKARPTDAVSVTSVAVFPAVVARVRVLGLLSGPPRGGSFITDGANNTAFQRHGAR